MIKFMKLSFSSGFFNLKKWDGPLRLIDCYHFFINPDRLSDREEWGCELKKKGRSVQEQPL
jgi:hypothetical protein